MMLGWRPMNTAPTDERRVLLKVEAGLGTKVIEAWYTSFGMGSAPRWMPWCGNEAIKTTEYIKPLAWIEVPK